MYRLRYRLVFAVVLITLLVMSGLGWTIAKLYENYYLHNLTSRLEKEANLAAVIFEEQGFTEENIYRLTADLSKSLDVRVTVISNNGTVLDDSHANIDSMENHYMRPEIEAIVSGEIGSSIRYSETLGEEMLYYAVPIGDNIGFVRLGLSTTTLTEMNKRVWTILFASFSFAFFVIVFITVRVARQMVGPIEKVTAVANELAKGNYRARTSEDRNDEIGQLTRAMNMLAFQLDRMTKNYEAQQEQMATLIENMGSGLLLIDTRGDIVLVNQSCRDIFHFKTNEYVGLPYYNVVKEKEMVKFIQSVFMTEIKQRKQVQFSEELHFKHFDLYGAPILNKKGKLTGIVIVLHEITELKKLEQIRKDFVANVSHELKTPVTSIKGFAETLLDGAMEEPSLRSKFLQIIYKESKRLQYLVQDLLELSKIEHQYFTLDWQKTDITEIVQEVSELLGDKAKEKNIQLRSEVIGDSIVEADRQRLKQIIINLVENAVTYTPSGGEIQMIVNGMEDDVQIKIKDSGVGINEKDVPRIFERFYRVDRARARQSGGTGLGLAIVKHLVEAHHGKIEVESKIGKGTVFTITLNRNRPEEVKG